MHRLFGSFLSVSLSEEETREYIRTLIGAGDSDARP